MITLGTKSWGSSPTISMTFYYEKKRSGADMLYRVQVSISDCDGSSYFGYPIYMRLYIADALRCTVTLKGASPTQWSSAITYTSAWYTVSNVGSGTVGVKFNLYSGSGSARDETYSFSMAVDPGKSTLSVGNGTLGTAQTLTINRLSSSFIHDVYWECGDKAEYILWRSNLTSVQWTPPLTLAAENPTGESVQINLVIHTFSGEVLVGTNEYPITCTIPSSVKPTLTNGWAVAAPYNTGTAAANIGAFVQGYSKAQVSFNSSKINMDTAYGATIQYYKIVMGSYSSASAPHLTPVLSTAGNVYITCYVYDSRGRYASETLTIPVHEYKKPTLRDISAYRSDGEGASDGSGTYIAVKASSVVSGIGGLNTGSLRARLKVSGGSYGAYTDLTSNITAVLGDGLISVKSTYIAEITLTDTLGNSALYTGIVPTEAVFFMGLEGGTGAAFGKYPELDNTLDIQWDLYARGDVYGSLYGLGKVHQIPWEADFNEYLDFGVYACTANATAERCYNCPTTSAGRLIVSSANGTGERLGAYVYILQEYITLDGSTRYYRLCYSNVNGEWQFNEWKT